METSESGELPLAEYALYSLENSFEWKQKHVPGVFFQILTLYSLENSFEWKRAIYRASGFVLTHSLLARELI